MDGASRARRDFVRSLQEPLGGKDRYLAQRDFKGVRWASSWSAPRNLEISRRGDTVGRAGLVRPSY